MLLSKARRSVHVQTCAQFVGGIIVQTGHLDFGEELSARGGRRKETRTSDNSEREGTVARKQRTHLLNTNIQPSIFTQPSALEQLHTSLMFILVLEQARLTQDVVDRSERGDGRYSDIGQERFGKVHVCQHWSVGGRGED